MTERSVRPDHRMVGHTGFLTVGAARYAGRLRRVAGHPSASVPSDTLGKGLSLPGASAVRERKEPSRATSRVAVEAGIHSTPCAEVKRDARPRRAGRALRGSGPRAPEPGEVPGGGGRPAAPAAHERAPAGHAPRGEARRDPRAARARRWARTRSSPTPCGPSATRSRPSSRRSRSSRSRPPPSACTSRTNDDGSLDVFTAGRKMRVMPAPDLDERAFRPGVQVVLNESLNVVEVLEPDRAGEVVKVKDKLGDDRVIVVGRGDEEYVAHLAGSLLDTPIRVGRQRPVRHPVQRRGRAAAQGRGRGARPRGDPRRQLRGHRRARGPDRLDPRRRRAAVPLRGAVPRARARGAQGHPALRASRVRQDPDREGRGRSRSPRRCAERTGRERRALATS